MIKTLKKKFIKAAMMAITLLLVVLLAALNITNYTVQQRQSQELLTVLCEGRGDFRNSPPPKQENSFLGKPFVREGDMRQPYFSVRYSQEGEVIGVNLTNITSIGEEEAMQLAEEIMSYGEIRGKHHDYLFAKNEIQGPKGEEINVVLLDNSLKKQSLIMVLVISIFSGLGCWLMMLLVVILLSQKAISPIAENMERQKQFVTDAGHEIKTPLAIILSNAEAMELYNGENKWIKNIKEQAERLNGLMQNLLLLSKMDETALTLNMTEFSLKELTEDTVNMYETAAERKKLGINRVFEEVSVKGNRDALGRLISIIMDNAVKYSKEDSIIEVTLSKTGKNTILTIESTSAAPLTGNPEILFQRFYRGDSARTQKSGGYGIGLSSAKSIVEFHKGNIEAKYKEGQRILFIISL